MELWSRYWEHLVKSETDYRVRMAYVQISPLTGC